MKVGNNHHPRADNENVPQEDRGRLEIANKVIPCCDRKDSTHPVEGTAISRFPSAISVILFPMDE